MHNNFENFLTKIIVKLSNHTLLIDVLVFQVATWIQPVESVLVSSWLNPHCKEETSKSISSTFWDSAIKSLCLSVPLTLFWWLGIVF